MADCAPAPWSAFNDVEDQLLRSLPPSQDYLTPPDTALLRSSFPQLLQHFLEADAVALMMLGLRDRGAVRVGFTHYNTLDEVDALIAALKQIAG